MAKISDIITARNYSDDDMDPKYLDVRDTTQGATDALYTNNVIQALGGNDSLPAWISAEGIEYEQEPTMPTLPMFFKILGLTDDPEKVNGKTNKNRKTAYEKFINGYGNKDTRDSWHKKIAKIPELGENAWETLKGEWRSAVNDKMQQDIAKAKYEAVHDGTVSGFLARTAFPRSTERIANGGDIQNKDVALDIGENLAMLIPGTGFTKLGGMAARKVAPSLVTKAGRAADALRAARMGYIPGAAQMAANTAGNTVVPLASEIADDIVYDPGEGMDDRANFSVGDVVLGGAINQAVNRGLIRAIAPYIDRYSGELKAVGAKKMRDFFESLGRSKSALGENFANDVRLASKEPVVRVFEDGTRITPNELAALKQGENVIPEGQTTEEFLNNVTTERVLDLIDDGTLTMRDAKTIAGKVGKRQAQKEKHLASMEQEYNKEAELGALAGDDEYAIAMKKKAEDLNKLRTSGKTLTGASAADIIKGTATTGDVANSKMLLPEEAREQFMSHPELFNYAYWKNAGTLDKVQNLAHQAWPSLVINKAGKTNYAPEVTKVYKDDIEENRDKSRYEGKKVEVKRVLDAGKAAKNLTAEDEEFLKDVANDPDILTVGHPTKPEKFKLWLLLGGNDKLRGTSAHRPLWDVE